MQLKAYLPKVFRDTVFETQLTREAKAIEKGIVNDYKATCSTWKNKPKIESLTSVKNGSIDIMVDVIGDIYAYVDKGTKPHSIFPKRAKFLRFKSQYRAKTAPGVLSSWNGGGSGGNVFRKAVRHPGIKGRKFSEMIKKKWDARYQLLMQQALTRAAKQSGYSL